VTIAAEGVVPRTNSGWETLNHREK
jgi:hypothetical protein